MHTRRGATLSFLWLDPATWGAEEWKAVQSASLVLLSYGSHAPTRGEAPAFLDGTLAEALAKMRCGPRPPRLAVWEYSPAHFPGTPHGELIGWHGRCAAHDRSVKPPGSNLGCPCSPACVGCLDAFTNFRRDFLSDFAANHSLPLVPSWEIAVANADDHPGHHAGATTLRGGANDCRHWCNPGRTLQAQVEAVVAFAAGGGGAA